MKPLLIFLAGAALCATGCTQSTPPAPKAAAPAASTVVQDGSGRRVLYWHDPMVPGSRFDRPGRSPYMDMDLVPKYADENDAGADGLAVAPATAQALGIRLDEARVTAFGAPVRAVGRIEADERRLYEMQARTAGFVEQLLVRAEGEPVKAGQRVADVYAPELLAAQQEYLALLRAQSIGDGHDLARAARERLALLGMAPAEIDAVAKSGTARRRVGLFAPASGYVTALAVREGAQIAPGAMVMRIADLASVWLVADVPERDAGRLKPGDPLVAELESLPGESFAGKVEYVYPTLDTATRSVRVRMVLPNDRRELRPGMFASATIETARHEALSVPTEAVIVTGTRSVVIIGRDGRFVPLEVKTGAEQDGRTEILAGLQAGQSVVASGQFLIDSEANLRAALARMGEERPR